MNADPYIDNVEVRIPAAALTTVFDECDKYNADETGGRLIGTYKVSWFRRFIINVTGIIEPGPSASRTATSFFQDGEYQANVFRDIEALHPEVEHLGNWHTHHVNGYPTLSGGDRETYRRIVNHKQHNTKFFYALLVVSRGDPDDPLNRYYVRHFLLRRNDSTIYEIPPKAIKITNTPLWWPTDIIPKRGEQKAEANAKKPVVEVADRGIDQQLLRELYPKLNSFFSENTHSIYWKGAIELVDGIDIPTIIAEVNEGSGVNYVVHLKDERKELVKTIKELEKMKFNTGRVAAFTIQNKLNRQLFQSASERR